MANKTYVCRKIRLYNFLTEKGFKPFDTVPDKYNASRVVWIYYNTPELEAAVEEYYSKVNYGNN